MSNFTSYKASSTPVSSAANDVFDLIRKNSIAKQQPVGLFAPYQFPTITSSPSIQTSRAIMNPPIPFAAPNNFTIPKRESSFDGQGRTTLILKAVPQREPCFSASGSCSNLIPSEFSQNIEAPQQQFVSSLVPQRGKNLKMCMVDQVSISSESGESALANVGDEQEEEEEEEQDICEVIEGFFDPEYLDRVSLYYDGMEREQVQVLRDNIEEYLNKIVKARAILSKHEVSLVRNLRYCVSHPEMLVLNPYMRDDQVDKSSTTSATSMTFPQEQPGENFLDILGQDFFANMSAGFEPITATEVGHEQSIMQPVAQLASTASIMHPVEQLTATASIMQPVEQLTATASLMQPVEQLAASATLMQPAGHLRAIPMNNVNFLVEGTAWESVNIENVPQYLISMIEAVYNDCGVRDSIVHHLLHFATKADPGWFTLDEYWKKNSIDIKSKSELPKHILVPPNFPIRLVNGFWAAVKDVARRSADKKRKSERSADKTAKKM